MVIHGLQEVEKVGPVVGKLLQVLVDHLQSALEDGVEDARQSTENVIAQSINDGCHRVQDLGLTSDRRTLLIVGCHGIKKGRKEIVGDLEKRMRIRNRDWTISKQAHGF